MKFIETWKNYDDKLRDRAIEELLRFMTLFSTSAALICFFGTLLQQGDMRVSLILLTLMAIISVSWFIKKRKNEEKWGVARRTGAEIFRIGKTQPTKEERMGILLRIHLRKSKERWKRKTQRKMRKIL